MELVYLGKITSFHGIKGEIRIISDFDYISDALKVGNTILIDEIPHIIKSYRRHKNYEMITIDDYTNINEVLYLKNKKIYIDRKYLNKDILDNDLINMTVIYNNEEKGFVKRVEKISLKKKIIVVEYKHKEIYIPYEFINKVNKEEKRIYIDYLEGLGL